jgi:formylglycine-generating enzyme required for sulfatase activity
VFSIDFVTVGNPGNPDDAGAGGGIYSSPHGGVDYLYRMGSYEISLDMVNKAVDGGLRYVDKAGAYSDDVPATHLTWYQAALFVNWLNTSSGHPAAYQVSYDAGFVLTPWQSADAWKLGGENRYRHKDAYYFLPSEDEWYKAAYHKNDGVTANYWDYATASNTIPTAVRSGTDPNTAVYDDIFLRVPIKEAGGLSAYGTMAQNGNVREWMESAFDGSNDSDTEAHVILGGYWESNGSILGSSDAFRMPAVPTQFLDDGDHYDGFRVASVPEPSLGSLITGGLMLLLRRRCR